VKITVGIKEFKTKKALTEYVRAVRDKYKIGEKIKGEDRLFLISLLERHKWAGQKIGCGIDYFYTEYTEWRTKGFRLVRTDGTDTDFSFLCCITPNQSDKKDFIKACRQAIKEQILEVKNNYSAGIKACDKCGCAISYSTCEVDHYPIMFKDIVKEFLERFPNIELDKVTCCDDWDGVSGVVITDEYIIKEWQKEHRNEATYRFLCVECNRNWRNSWN